MDTINNAIFRGGSRISRRRGRQPSGGGAPTYKFARFSQKLHEIKKSLVRKGAPPLDPPLILFIDTVNVFLKYLKHLGHVSCMDCLFMWPYLIKFDWLIDWFVMESCQSMALRNNGLWALWFPWILHIFCLSVCFSVSPVCFLTLTAQCISLGIVLQVAGISFHFVPGSSVSSVGTTFCLKYAPIK